jgi:predicted deacetylase
MCELFYYEYVEERQRRGVQIHVHGYQHEAEEKNQFKFDQPIFKLSTQE